MRWGGGGAPSIDEPDGEKPKVFPQPEEELGEVIPYSEAISSTTAFNNFVAEKQIEDSTFTYSLQGSGTEEDPYQIGDFYDFIYAFNKMGLPSNKYYILTDDIIFNDGKFVENEETGEIEYHSGESGELRKFSHITDLHSDIHFDGQGHSIKGFYGIGLFYRISYRTLNNSTFKDFHFVNSYSYQGTELSIGGILANQVENCNFENCSTDGWVKGGRPGANIFIYYANNSTFKNCINYGKNISENANANYGNAGIVGYATNCLIEDCENYGDNLTGRYSASIVGRADGTTKVIGCKNHGNIKTGYSGGIGYASSSSVVFENCENHGVCRVGISCGGTIINCINYAECISAGIGGSAYDGAIPTLIENCKNYGRCPTGIGSATTIKNCVNYKLQTSGVTGIGSATTIQNCINYASVENGSSFTGIGSGTTISNCKNYGNAIVSDNASGIGLASNTTDCVNFGDIASKSGRAGGITAFPTKVTKIVNCINYGDIRCERYGSDYGGGGIIGATYGYSPSILNCVNNGNISGASSGGLVGNIYSNGGINKLIVQNCVNAGYVSGTNTGGFVACARESTVVEIYNCINHGSVTKPGVFIGYKHSGATINFSNCYSDGDVESGNSSLIGTGSTSCTVNNVIIEGKANGVVFKKYYGSNFKAFFVAWKDNHIGLKAFESIGAFQGIVDEEVLGNLGYEKIA